MGSVFDSVVVRAANGSLQFKPGALETLDEVLHLPGSHARAKVTANDWISSFCSSYDPETWRMEDLLSAVGSGRAGGGAEPSSIRMAEVAACESQLQEVLDAIRLFKTYRQADLLARLNARSAAGSSSGGGHDGGAAKVAADSHAGSSVGSGKGEAQQPNGAGGGEPSAAAASREPVRRPVPPSSSSSNGKKPVAQGVSRPSAHADDGDDEDDAMMMDQDLDAQPDEDNDDDEDEEEEDSRGARGGSSVLLQASRKSSASSSRGSSGRRESGSAASKASHQPQPAAKKKRASQSSAAEPSPAKKEPRTEQRGQQQPPARRKAAKKQPDPQAGAAEAHVSGKEQLAWLRRKMACPTTVAKIFKTLKQVIGAASDSNAVKATGLMEPEATALMMEAWRKHAIEGSDGTAGGSPQHGRGAAQRQGAARSVTCEVLSFLHFFCNNPSSTAMKNLLGSNGAADLIALAMYQYAEDVEVVKLALEAVWRVSDHYRNDSDSMKLVRKMAVATPPVEALGGKDAPTLMQLLQRALDHDKHKKDAEVMYYGMAAAANFVSEDKNTAQMGPGLSETVHWALSQFGNNSDVMQQTCRAVGNLCCRNPKNQKTLVDRGCCELVMKVVRRRLDDVDLLFEGCHAIRGLAANYSLGARRLIEMGEGKKGAEGAKKKKAEKIGAVEVMLHVIGSNPWDSDEATCRVVSGLIFSIGSRRPASIVKAGALGAVGKVLLGFTKMTRPPDDLLEDMCISISNMAAADRALRTQLIEAGALQHVANLVVEYKQRDSYDLYEAACVALTRLIDDECEELWGRWCPSLRIIDVIDALFARLGRFTEHGRFSESWRPSLVAAIAQALEVLAGAEAGAEHLINKHKTTVLSLMDIAKAQPLPWSLPVLDTQAGVAGIVSQLSYPPDPSTGRVDMRSTMTSAGAPDKLLDMLRSAGQGVPEVKDEEGGGAAPKLTKKEKQMVDARCEVMRKALQALTTLTSKQDARHWGSEKGKKCVREVVDALVNGINIKHAGLAEDALRVLINLCNVDLNVQYLLSDENKGCEAVCSALQQFEKEVLVQHKGINCLYNLVCTGEDWVKGKVFEGGAVALWVTALRNFPYDSTTVQEVTAAMGNLYVKASVLMLEEFDQRGVLKEVVGALRRSLQSAPEEFVGHRSGLLHWTLYCVMAMCDCDDDDEGVEHRVRLQEELGKQGVCEMVCSVLKRRADLEPRTVSKALGAASNMASRCKANRDRLGKAGFCELLLKVLRSPPKAKGANSDEEGELLTFGLNCVEELVKGGHPANMQRLHKAGAIDVIQQVKEKGAKSQKVREWIAEAADQALASLQEHMDLSSDTDEAGAGAAQKRAREEVEGDEEEGEDDEAGGGAAHKRAREEVEGDEEEAEDDEAGGEARQGRSEASSAGEEEQTRSLSTTEEMEEQVGEEEEAEREQGWLERMAEEEGVAAVEAMMQAGPSV